MRHSKRNALGRFTPADALDTGAVPDASTSQVLVTSNPWGEHDMPAAMTQYPSDFEHYKPLSGHENGRRNPHLGMYPRGTYADSAGIPVPKPEQARKHYFLSPATSTIATRAEKDARIVGESYARDSANLGENYG
jgi:hypothetical protein